MKKRFVSLLVALSITLTFLPIGAVAATPIKKGDLKYTVNADGQSVTVSGTSGNPRHLTIESSISDNGTIYTVTKIGMGAFNSTLEEVTLPPTLDEIEDSAFFKCSSLTEITIPRRCYKNWHKCFLWLFSINKHYDSEYHQKYGCGFSKQSQVISSHLNKWHLQNQ